MIALENVSKSFRLRGGTKVILNDVTLTFPPGVAVGLMGRNGAGKSTLLQMISGTVKPDKGRIRISGSVSWQVGFSGSFHRDMTGVQNTRFIGRLYGVDTDELVAFVEDFAELGPHFHAPVRTYSSGMKSRLAFGISIGIPFDTYLIDEATAVGDAAFKQKSRLLFAERMKQAGALFVTHSMSQMRTFCQAGVVLENGELTYFNDVDEAIRQHERNMGTDEDE